MDEYRPRREPRLHELRGRRGQIGLTSWGPPSPDPILLLHGWMDCGAAMQLLVDQLPDDWSLTAIDWPGYGRSDAYDGGYWHPEYVADLDHILDEMLPGRAARVIAHSLGGAIAQMLAGLRPQRLQWLVNMEGFGLPKQDPESVPDRMVEWLDALKVTALQKSYPSLRAVVDSLSAKNPCMPLPHARFLARTWTREVATGGVQLLADELHRIGSPMRFSREELEACWTRIRIPLLMLHGSESQHLKRSGGEAALSHWQSLIPTLQAGEVSGAGHLMPYEQPRQVADHILRFVSALA